MPAQTIRAPSPLEFRWHGFLPPSLALQIRSLSASKTTAYPSRPEKPKNLAFSTVIGVEISEFQHLLTVVFVGAAADAADVFLGEELRTSEGGRADEDPG